MHSKWQIGRQISKKFLDIKRRARICADEMACKTAWQIFIAQLVFLSLTSRHP